MTILNAILFTMMAGIVTLEVFLFAAAAVLLVHALTHRIRQRKVSAPTVQARHASQDKYV
jgi:hypothetical protein